MPLSTNYSFQNSALLADVDAQAADGLLDYAGFGTASVVISGLTGLTNTIIGIGDMLGVADENSYIDEGRAVTTILGQQGGEFYMRHKQGVDFLGLIASSIVPGALGIKALRAVQHTGKIWDPMKYSTGLRNADITLDSPLVNAAKASALKSNTTSILNPEYYKAIGAGFKQQVMENIAFSAGMILLNNQNATLNPDDLGYLEAAGSQVMHDLPFIAFGAVLGTGIDALRIGGAVRRFAKEEQNRVVFTTAAGAAITAGSLRNLEVPELRGMNSGDAIITLAAESTARSKIEKGLHMQDGNGAEILPQVNEYAYNNIMNGKNILNTEFNTVVTKMNKAGPEGFGLLKDMFDDMANAVSDRKYVLAAMDEVGYITPKGIAAVDPAQLVARKVLDNTAVKLEALGSDQIPARLSVMTSEELLGVASRLGQAGTKHTAELTTAVTAKFPTLLSAISPKLVKVHGSPVAALMHEADTLLSKGLITQTEHAALQPNKLTGFANTVTKEVRTKITPRIADFGAARLKDSGKLSGATLYSEVLNQTFKYEPAAFSNAILSDVASTATTLPKLQQLDANFQIAHTIKMDYTKKTPLVIDPSDIAMLERLAKDGTDEALLKAFAEGRVQLGGNAATQASITGALIESKSRLIANLQAQGMNADDIAVAANTKHTIILGEEPLNAANVVGRTQYSSPEWLEVTYANRNIKDYNKQVDDFTGQAQRNKLYETQKQIALQELGHADFVNSMPELRLAELGSMSSLEERTGIFKRLNAEFGSMRETLMYYGKQVNNEIKKATTRVYNKYASAEAKFNKPENGLMRAELELAVNFLRTGDMMLHEGYVVNKQLLQTALKGKADAIEAGELAVADVIAELPAGAFISVGADVRSALESYQQAATVTMQKRSAVAEALGTNKSYDPDILRAPPVDLSQYRMVAFVRPSTAMQANDATKYMVYAQTAEELNTKISAMQVHLGDSYSIIRKGEDQEYFKAMQQYEYGHEFKDIYSDISKANRGRTADALPPLSGSTSRALQDMKRAEMRNEQYVIRASVELKNAEVLEQMRRYGDFIDNAERTSLSSNFTKRGSHIYSDSVALMLDLPGYKGETSALWNTVNTAVAQRGSAVVDFISAQGQVLSKATGFISDTYKKIAGKPIEARAFDWDSAATAELTQLMQEGGHLTPLLPMTDLLMQSTDAAVSNSAAELSRKLASLVSLTMLRADPTHSLMQFTSSTILSLPVMKELMAKLPEAAARITGVIHPTTGFIEPNVAKLYAKGNARAFSSKPEHTQFLQDLKDRGIVTDYISQMLDAVDMAALNGSHSIADVNSKFNKMAGFISKYSGHTKSEEAARFAIADATREVCEALGIPKKEMWPIISNAVDKVHGNYIASQRPQLFNGVIGQNVGLFQTYFFNMMQHATKHIADGQGKQLALLGGLQASMFGAQSIPGFTALNALVARASDDKSDLYDIAGANDPNSWSSYGMFGLGSQAFGIDFSGRGNLNPRYATIVPTDFQNLATVSVLTGAIGNLYKTGALLADDNVSVGTALAHGIAHNGMNRPLQGLGTILQGAVTSGTGQVDIANANMDEAGNLAWGTMFSRLIGARPMDEAITRSHFYRQAGYDAAHRDEMAKLSATIQQDGVEDWGQIATEYENAGGNLQQFNAFIMRNMQTATEGKLGKFRQDMEMETQLNRSVTRMQYRDSLKPYWEK